MNLFGFGLSRRDREWIEETLTQALQPIASKLDEILRGERKMSAELDALAAQVEQNTTVEESAVTLIQGLAAQIAAAANDPAAIAALSAKLQSSATALAAAIAANTPAAPQ